MIALISPAKTMKSGSPKKQYKATTARFLKETYHIVSLMQDYSSLELGEIFKVSQSIAIELRQRFKSINRHQIATTTAIESYDGVVYKHIKGDGGLTIEQANYLQERVRISSLLYGLLRPLDAIEPYRMEGFVRLSDGDIRVDNFWREIQTDQLIEDVKQEGGTLLYLASKEEQKAFDWRKVKKEIEVIDIEFLQHKGDKLRQVVVYTKMARGEMIRYMAKNKITEKQRIKEFEWQGYKFREELSTPNRWTWVMEE